MGYWRDVVSLPTLIALLVVVSVLLILASRALRAPASAAKLPGRDAKLDAAGPEAKTKELDTKTKELEAKTRELDTRRRELDAKAEELDARARKLDTRAEPDGAEAGRDAGRPRPTADVEPTRGAAGVMAPESDEPATHTPRLSDDDEEEDDADLTKFVRKAEVPSSSTVRAAGVVASASDDPDAARFRFEDGAAEGPDEPEGDQQVIAAAAAGQTDQGLSRRRNEDAFVIDDARGLYVVADGMGGYRGGDVAARLACHEISAAVLAPGAASSHAGAPRRGRELVGAIEAANAAVRNKGRALDIKDMGTTVVAARLAARSQRIYIASVGDSRCYRLRGQTLTQLTTDHTLEGRGVDGPIASHLSRAVGVEETVVVDLVVDRPVPDDVYVLCSDGLTKMLSTDDIREIIVPRIFTINQEAMRRVVTTLIAAANGAGGRDNVTVIALGIREITRF